MNSRRMDFKYGKKGNKSHYFRRKKDISILINLNQKFIKQKQIHNSKEFKYNESCSFSVQL